MRTLDPIKQLEILRNTYVTADMIYNLYPIGKTTARELVNEIIKDLESKKIPILKGKRKYVPISEVLKRYPIDEKRLQK